MTTEDWIEENAHKMMKFRLAQRRAEELGKRVFVCPLCGGLASWDRADSNRHLHCSCRDCGTLIIE